VDGGGIRSVNELRPGGVDGPLREGEHLGKLAEGFGDEAQRQVLDVEMNVAAGAGGDPADAAFRQASRGALAARPLAFWVDDVDSEVANTA
jgi:hypothetical protein